MHVLIIEDEWPQALQLRTLPEESGVAMKVDAMLQSVGEAVEFLGSNRVDLIFLDIHLADGLCFSLFERTKVTAPVIFTTAYDQYTLEAFRHNGIDYLLKPVAAADLNRSLSKYLSIAGPPADYASMLQTLKAVAAGIRPHRKRFISRFGKTLRIVATDDIAYFYTLGGGVFIRTVKNENLLVDSKMETLEQQLDPYEFFRLNRRVIARVSAIREMHPWSKSRIKVILSPPFEEEVVVSYPNVKEFMKWIGPEL